MKNSSDHNSDSDDWTLISPPHSSSSSPDREQPLNIDELRRNVPQGPQVCLEGDGLMEVDLSETGPKVAAHEDNDDLGGVSGRSSTTDPSDASFQPLDTTSDEEIEENKSISSDSRRSSLTQSELGEYVDISKRDLKDSSETILEDSSEDTNVLQDNGAIIDDIQTRNVQLPSLTSQREDVGYLTSIKTMFDDLNEAVQASKRTSHFKLNKLTEWNEVENLFLFRVLSRILLSVTLIVYAYLAIKVFILLSGWLDLTAQHTTSKMPSALNNNLDMKFNLGDSIPTSHQYVELKLLHSELSQCIKRQSPTSFKYYMSEDRFKDSDQSSTRPYQSAGLNQKPYRGLVCYGQEMQWRERFNRLKSEYDLDLRRLMQEAKKTVTNEVLEFYHPSLQFKLILNQIEYLDFLENKRNKKQSEETIKYLKAENFQLLRRLNQPNDTGYRKVVVNLELQNAKLQRENEALKSNLIGKAGPTYIRQSLELEQYERENLLLKQFHHQVAQELSKSLKQFNLHIIDASTLLDDHESLKAQLMLTRGYLRRLNEKIGTMLIENESLKEELKETYLFGSANKANLPAAHNPDYSGESTNNSNALVLDSCMRNLLEVKERSDKLESELAKMKQNCQRNVNLEKSSERHLNRTGCGSELFRNEASQNSWKRLGSLETALDKHLKDPMTAQDDNDNIVDELIVFLSKFDHQVKSWTDSNSLTTIENQDGGLPSSESEYLVDNRQAFPDTAKTIPNYIREAVRSFIKKQKFDLQVNSNHLELPHTPPPLNNPSTLSEPISSKQEVVQNKIVEPKKHEQVQTEDLGVNRNTSHVEDIVEGASPVDPVPMNVGPSWLFKRAKQRKQLRRDQDEPETNWMIMRATLRDTLRKAASYIDRHYIDGVRETIGGKRKMRHKTSASQENDSKHKHNAKASKQQKTSKGTKRNQSKQSKFRQEL